MLRVAMSRKRNRFIDDIAGCGDDNEDDEDGLEEENSLEDSFIDDEPFTHVSFNIALN